jgi:hypothetical protein
MWARYQAGCKRLAAYEANGRAQQKAQRQPSAAPLTQTRAWRERPEVRQATHALRRAKDSLQRTLEDKRQQQGREAAYAKAHPIRAAQGLERDRGRWAATRARLEQQEQTERTTLLQAKQKVRTLSADAGFLAYVHKDVARAQAQRDRARTQQAALKERQAQQAKRYTADEKLVAEMTQQRQARDVRMATHRDLQQRLEAARTQLAQTKQTPQQLWEELPAVREATQKVQAATQALDSARKRAPDMARECADYANLRPARAALGYGTPYKPAELRRADLAVRRAEQTKRGAEGHLRFLANDLPMQSQQVWQRDAQSASQLQTQKRAAELGATLRERAEQYARDFASLRAQHTYVRGRANVRQRGAA